MQNQRTQIILPKNLRQEIDQQRRSTGQSLAEFLRQAAQEKIARDKKTKVDLKKLAQQVVGAAAGTRTEQEINDWIEEIREDRRQLQLRCLLMRFLQQLDLPMRR